MPDSRKPKNYLKYAIGEIILVMVGILLAFQVNHWNEERQNRTKERLMLDALHKEFLQNKAQFDTVFKHHEQSLKSFNYLKNQLPIDLKKVDLDSLVYHLYHGVTYWTFNPFQGVTNSLISTASFDLIRNDELRALLISWHDMVLDYQEEELLAKESVLAESKQFDTQYLAWSDDSKEWLNDSRVDLKVLTTLAFDNFVLTRQFRLSEIVNNSVGEADSVRMYIDRIISLSAPEKD